MDRITQEQYEELVYMMGHNKKRIMDDLGFGDEMMKDLNQKSYKWVKDVIFEWKHRDYKKYYEAMSR